MKENLILDKSLIYQWTFNDNMSIVDNPRVKATVNGNPTFKDGVATFNGSTDYYKLKTIINLGTKYSIEVKFKLNSIQVAAGYVLAQGSSSYPMAIAITNKIYHAPNPDSVHINWTRDLNWHTYTICRNGTSVLIYLDGVLQTNSGILSATSTSKFNSVAAISNTGSNLTNISIEYIKIWNRQLTASEVKNNYLGKTYRNLPYKSTTLFHINSDNGVIRDLTGKTTPTPTNVTLSKIGSNISVMKFNGSSGNINIGSQALVKDITIAGWINMVNLGEGGFGRIISNGKLSIYISSGNKLNVSRDDIANILSAINTFKLSSNQFICITSTSAGITNIYVGDKINPPALSGSANQSAGTPVAGSTCYLGNRAADDRTLNGWLNDIRCEQSILTLEEITQVWSNTKIKY